MVAHRQRMGFQCIGSLLFRLGGNRPVVINQGNLAVDNQAFVIG